MAVIQNTYTTYVEGTSEDDLIYNYVSAYVHGNRGNDNIANAAPIAYMNGDSGNDLVGNNAWYSYTYLEGGRGNDYVINQGSGTASLYGGYGVDDYYNDSDTLVGGYYATDVFIVGEYCGYDVIQNYESNDIILCATTSGNLPYAYVWGDDIIIDGTAMRVIVQGGAHRQFNFGYTNGYNAPSFDAAADNLWENANTYYGTADADNIFVGKGDGNDLVFGTAQDDTIHLCDVALSDIVATAVNDNSISITFNTGETTAVETSGSLSPAFKLASGESYVYNRESGSWQSA